MTITTTLVQTSLTSAEFSLVSVTEVIAAKHDIRVRLYKQGGIGSTEISSDSKSYPSTAPLKINADPHTFTIPLSENPEAMVNGQLYTVIIHLYDVNNIQLYTRSGIVIYDAREISVDSISIVNTPPTFSHLTPLIKIGETEMPPNDPFYAFIKFDKIDLSVTRLMQDVDGFVTGEDYHLGVKPYAPATTNVWDTTYLDSLDSVIKPLPFDSAFDFWGSVSLGKADAFTAFQNEGVTFILPFFSFMFEFYSTENIGYKLAVPDVALTLGDVVGTVSLIPIQLLINNFDSYSNYKPDSVTLNVRATANAQTTPLFTVTKNHAAVVNKTFIVTVADLGSSANGNPLTNGVTYYFETVLNFTDSYLYVPSQFKSVEVSGMFKDIIEPVTVARVENSWGVDSAQGAGLLVTFQKTDQFMGNVDVAYNLDMYGNTSVLVEYNVLDEAGNLTAWVPFSGGSAGYGFPSLNPSNTDGVYAIPKTVATASSGSAQPPILIYSVIPNQSLYNLVQFRMTLVTTNSSFATDKSTSTAFVVPAHTGYTYPFTASVRYFPAPVNHSFTVLKPSISDIDGNDVNLIVPVSVPAYFSSSVVASNGVVSGTPQTVVSGTASIVSNNTPNATRDYVTGNVTGLSYLGTDDASFDLFVKYIYSENTSVFTSNVSMPVQMQRQSRSGDEGFTIQYAVWNRDTQKVDYSLSAPGAGAVSAIRIDGWNMYVKDSNESNNDFKLISSPLRAEGTGSVGLTVIGTGEVLTYADYSTLVIKFVATRSMFLDSQELTGQVESFMSTGNRGLFSTQITKLPGTLPAPTLANVAVSNPIFDVNGPANQNATLTATLAANVAGVRITKVSDSSQITSTSLSIPLSSTPTGMLFTVEYGYTSLRTGVSTFAYSDGISVSFNTGTSNASVPVIVSKAYVDAPTFTVAYTSSDASVAATNNSLSSRVMVGMNSINAFVGTRENNGSVNLSGYKGNQVIVFIRNVFTCSYVVGSEPGSTTQEIDRSGTTFYVAANPEIVDSSIAVQAEPNTITFDVKNNGAPGLFTIFVMAAQDAGTSNGDDGTVALAMFSGVALGSPATNELSGGPAHTMTVTGETGTGYDRVSSCTFQCATDLSTADAKVVLYVSNANEGADSASVSVTPTIPPLIQRAANGTTIQYTGTAQSVIDEYNSPTPKPLFIQANPRGTGLELFAVVNDSSKSMLMNYASNLSSGLGRDYFTKSGQSDPIPFKNIVTTLMTNMASLFENVASFNEDIISWDTSSVTTMSRMFRNTRAFNRNIGGWNVSNVLDMSRMFETDPADPWSMFNNGGSGDIGNWNTSNVTNMNRMFTSAKSFNQDISRWDVTQVTDWNLIFSNAQTIFGVLHIKAPSKFR